MINYIIRMNYILSYTRYEKIKRLSPEDTCLVLTDLEFGNIGILSLYFIGNVFNFFDILNKSTMLIYIGLLLIFLAWAHFKIDKKIYRAPIRKTIKKMTEKDKKKYSTLAVLYLILSVLLWVFAFTWRVIIYGEAAMSK